jgi:hypothetical protein
MKNVSDKSYTENQNTQFIFNNLFSKEDVEKYYTARQAIDDNMAGVHCMIHMYDYKHTLKT